MPQTYRQTDKTVVTTNDKHYMMHCTAKNSVFNLLQF